MKAAHLTVLLALCALPLSSEERAPLPDFKTCNDAGIARFELDLKRAKSAHYQGLADPVDAAQVDVCGVNGIIQCDRGDAPLPCQHALATRQEALRMAILESLPAANSEPTNQLYPSVLALAHGSSAGDDCAGSTPVMEAWCEAREATRRVEMAVLAYQLAREEGAMEPAFELGWAQEPQPVRPKARKAEASE